MKKLRNLTTSLLVLGMMVLGAVNASAVVTKYYIVNGNFGTLRAWAYAGIDRDSKGVERPLGNAMFQEKGSPDWFDGAIIHLSREGDAVYTLAMGTYGPADVTKRLTAFRGYKLTSKDILFDGPTETEKSLTSGKIYWFLAPATTPTN